MAYQANHNQIKNDERGISTVETYKVKQDQQGKRRNRNWRKKIEAKIYQKDECNKMTQEQLKKVTEKERERKKRAGDCAYSKHKTATGKSSVRVLRSSILLDSCESHIRFRLSVLGSCQLFSYKSCMCHPHIVVN